MLLVMLDDDWYFDFYNESPRAALVDANTGGFVIVLVRVSVYDASLYYCFTEIRRIKYSFFLCIFDR